MPQVSFNCSLNDRRCLHPPWVRIFLVLGFDGKRDAIVNGSQTRNRAAQPPLSLHLTHLSTHKFGHRSRKAPLEEQIGLWKGSEREVSRNNSKQRFRHCCSGGQRLGQLAAQSVSLTFFVIWAEE